MSFFGLLTTVPVVITLSVSAYFLLSYLLSVRDMLIFTVFQFTSEASMDREERINWYNVTTDVLVVIAETANTGVNPCRSDYVMEAQDNLHWYLENIPGVTSVISLSSVAKRAVSGYAEGNLKWTYLPRDERALAFATSVVDPSTGLINEACSIMPIYVFTEDHKATTISKVVEIIDDYNKKFRSLDETITWRVMIEKPAEGTDVIPYAAVVGGTNTPLEDLDSKKPYLFSDDEFTDFAYESGFNSRNLWVQSLGNYYRDIDSFDENVNLGEGY